MNNNSHCYSAFQLAKHIHILCIIITVGRHTHLCDRWGSRQGGHNPHAVLVPGEIAVASRTQRYFTFLPQVHVFQDHWRNQEQKVSYFNTENHSLPTQEWIMDGLWQPRRQGY